jgi:ABC-2 type transport system permease protein
MRKILAIAIREYNAAVRTKSFLISLVVLPIMMGGGLMVQYLLKSYVDTRPRTYAVVDRSPGQQLSLVLEAAVTVRNDKEAYDPKTKELVKPIYTLERVAQSANTPEAIAEQRLELSRRVQAKEIDGFLDIGPRVLDHGPTDLASLAGLKELPTLDEQQVLRYQSNRPTYDAFYQWADKVLNLAIEEARGIKAGLPPGKLSLMMRPVPLKPKGLTKQDPATGQIIDGPDDNLIAFILVPAGLIVMMFMMVMIGATPLMQGVVEEKIQRIAEVLLGSVKPFQLMCGKLLGLVGVSLTLTAVYLGGSYLTAYHYDVTHYIPLTIIAWFLLYQVLAVLMYGSLFIAIGAACTDMRETQTLMWPVMLLACIPLFVWVNVVREPNSGFALAVSLFPFATPMLMIGRQAVPPGIGLFQPILGVVLVLLTTAACVYAAGRIFRVGILLQGKGAHFGDLVKWVIRG